MIIIFCLFAIIGLLGIPGWAIFMLFVMYQEEKRREEMQEYYYRQSPEYIQKQNKIREKKEQEQKLKILTEADKIVTNWETKKKYKKIAPNYYVKE
jgi:ABC-type protease/lipase transport system fused ATPase/permease subunit